MAHGDWSSWARARLRQTIWTSSRGREGETELLAQFCRILVAESRAVGPPRIRHLAGAIAHARAVDRFAARRTVSPCRPRSVPVALMPCCPSHSRRICSRAGAKPAPNFARSRNRLRRQVPAARFIRMETPEAFETAFDALVRLHQARWTQRGQAGSFSTPEFKTFHRAAARAALASGALRLYALQIGDVFAAIYYCFRVGSRVHLLQCRF